MESSRYRLVETGGDTSDIEVKMLDEGVLPMNEDLRERNVAQERAQRVAIHFAGTILSSFPLRVYRKRRDKLIFLVDGWPRERRPREVNFFPNSSRFKSKAIAADSDEGYRSKPESSSLTLS